MSSTAESADTPALGTAHGDPVGTLPPSVQRRMDTRISLHKLEILCLVVELGGIGRAAERLGVSQPVVTSHMRLLQDRVGAELLYRDGQHMRLTPAGEEVYQWAQEVLGRTRELARTIDGIAEGTAGSVTVGANMSVGSYLLPTLLADFARQHPHVSVTEHVFDAEDAHHAVVAGDCDFAVITTRSAVSEGVIRARRIGVQELVLVASPTDTRIAASIDRAALARIPFVCSPAGRPRRLAVDEALAELGVVRRSVLLELGHPEAIKAVTRKGLGVALLLRAAVQDELAAGTLREVTIPGARLQVPVVLIHRTDIRLGPTQRHLIEHLVRALAGRNDVVSDLVSALA